ncbi:MAG: hypothetical protein ACI3XM_11540 [Eubacteriales bacterium]
MDWIRKLRGIRGLPWLLLLFVLGLLLLIFPTDNESGFTSQKTEDFSDIPAYEAYLEHKIAQMTDALAGVSDSVVLVTLDSVPVSSQNSTSYYWESTGTQTNVPEIRGIAVVCRGGGKPDVQLAVISMLTAAFDIPACCVYVGSSEG